MFWSRSAVFIRWASSSSSAILLEHFQGKLGKNNWASIIAAKKVPNNNIVGVLPLPPTNDRQALLKESQEFAARAGLQKLIISTHDSFAHMLPEVVAPFLVQVQKKHNFSHWWSTHSSTGKNVIFRFVGEWVAETDKDSEGNLNAVSGDAKVSAISDIIEVKDEKTFVRPIYAGNAISTVQSTAPLTVITVRATAFQPDKTNTVEESSQQTVPTEEFPFVAPSINFYQFSDIYPFILFLGESISEWVADEVTKSDRPTLDSAEVVISGGRALKSADNFKLLYDLADAIGGAASITNYSDLS